MRLSARPGQALAEFAICAPLILSLLLGILDVGWLVNHQILLTNAAREGARLGTLGQDAPQIRTAVNAYLAQSGFTPLPPASGVSIELSGDAARVALRVEVPCLFAIAGPSLTLAASTEMPLE